MTKRARLFMSICIMALPIIIAACLLIGPAPDTPQDDGLLMDWEAEDSWSSTDTPLAIPTDETPILSSITITEPRYVHAITVTVNITHPDIWDLELALIAPDDSTYYLVTSPSDGGGADLTNMVFWNGATESPYDCSAPCTGVYVPDDRLPAGMIGTGTWQLSVVAYNPTVAGTLDDWTLELGLDEATPTVTPTATPIWSDYANCGDALYLFTYNYEGTDVRTPVGLPTYTFNDSCTEWSDRFEPINLQGTPITTPMALGFNTFSTYDEVYLYQENIFDQLQVAKGVPVYLCRKKGFKGADIAASGELYGCTNAGSGWSEPAVFFRRLAIPSGSSGNVTPGPTTVATALVETEYICDPEGYHLERTYSREVVQKIPTYSPSTYYGVDIGSFFPTTEEDPLCNDCPGGSAYGYSMADFRIVTCYDAAGDPVSTPTSTPGPTETPRAWISEVFRAVATPGCKNWNLRGKSCGWDDQFVEVAAPNGEALPGWRIVIEDGASNEVCNYTIKPDNFIFPMKAFWQDYMTTIGTPTPPAVCGQWPSNGEAVLYDAAGNEVDRRPYVNATPNASWANPDFPTPVATWEYQTPSPGTAW